MKLPDGHQVVMPYLILNGALKFIDFVKVVFDAEVTLNMHKMREDFERVMHSEIRIGGSTIMFSDVSDQWSERAGNLFVYVNNADETYHKALTFGASTLMDLTDQSYGRTCGIKDPFGNVWWITSVGK